MCKLTERKETQHPKFVGFKLTDKPGVDGQAVIYTDLEKPRAEWYFNPPAVVVNWCKANVVDQRDLPIAWLFWNMVTTTVPAALLLLFVLPQSHLLGAVYFVGSFLAYLQRFILGLHYSTHRRLFKPTPVGKALNMVASLVLCPLMGIPLGVYWLHHCGMHHTDNNAYGKDLSSTEGYQRDNPLHFMHYVFRYAVCAWAELPVYALKQRRWGIGFACMSFMTAYWAIGAAMYSFNPTATTWVWIAPFCLTACILMFGNWSQHIFVDPDDPRSNHKLTYNIINHPDNQRSFNDGFHVLHHLNSQTHWTDFPEKFMATLEDQAAKDTILFENIGFLEVGIAVLTGNLGTLADKYVQMPGAPRRTREEVIAMFKHRLQPVHTYKTTPAEKAK